MKYEFDVALVITQYKERRNCADVAKIYGCSAETIRRLLKDNGVKLVGWKQTGKPHRKRYKMTAEGRAKIAETYKSTENVIETANACGCSPTTVLKVLRQDGIPALNHGGSPRKITDAELIAESKTMTREQIAAKHHMNVCNVDRKLHRLGISCVKASPVMRGVTGKGGNYRSRAVAYGVKYDPHVTLKAVMKRDGGVCKLCGKPVDTADRRGNGAGYNYPTIDHIVPLSRGGGHVMSNVQLAHMICNSRKGADNAKVQTA